MPAAVSAEADSQIFSGVVAPIVFAKAASLLFCDAFIGVCAVAEQNAVETQLLRRAQPLQGCVADGIRQVRAILRAAPGTGAAAAVADCAHSLLAVVAHGGQNLPVCQLDNCALVRIYDGAVLCVLLQNGADPDAPEAIV